MKVVIEVELGNDAMQTSAEVAYAVVHALLRQPASTVDPLNAHECGTLRDSNGNTVGKWRVEP